MNTLVLITQILLFALAFVMFGLGLSLSLSDFKKALNDPVGIAIALILQIVVVPAMCYGLVVIAGLSPSYAIGLLLIAAAPSGPSSNLFTYLYKGDLATNVSITTLNTALSLITMPLIATWAVSSFALTGKVVVLPPVKVIEVIALVLVPILLGMFVATKARDFADFMATPIKVLSVIFLTLVIGGAISQVYKDMARVITVLGPIVLVFNVLNLCIGYGISRAAGMEKPASTAVGFSIGVRNGTLALLIAFGVFRDLEMALPIAIYSALMYLTAALFGFVLTHSSVKTKQ